MSIETLEKQLGEDPIIQKAYQFAKTAHEGQVRRLSNDPYVIHPLRMAILCSHYTHNPEVIIAALLHDTVEDTDVTLDQIEKEFGKNVRILVDPLTEKDKTMVWEERRSIAREELRSAPNDAILIKCADKIDNMSDIRDSLRNDPNSNPWRHFKRGPEAKIPEWESVYKIIENKYPNCPLLPSLRQVLNEIRELTQL